jgi:hypothetical protein
MHPHDGFLVFFQDKVQRAKEAEEVARTKQAFRESNLKPNRPGEVQEDPYLLHDDTSLEMCL